MEKKKLASFFLILCKIEDMPKISYLEMRTSNHAVQFCFQVLQFAVNSKSSNPEAFLNILIPSYCWVMQRRINFNPCNSVNSKSLITGCYSKNCITFYPATNRILCTSSLLKQKKYNSEYPAINHHDRTGHRVHQQNTKATRLPEHRYTCNGIWRYAMTVSAIAYLQMPCYVFSLLPQPLFCVSRFYGPLN